MGKGGEDKRRALESAVAGEDGYLGLVRRYLETGKAPAEIPAETRADAERLAELLGLEGVPELHIERGGEPADSVRTTFAYFMPAEKNAPARITLRGPFFSRPREEAFWSLAHEMFHAYQLECVARLEAGCPRPTDPPADVVRTWKERRYTTDSGRPRGFWAYLWEAVNTPPDLWREMRRAESVLRHIAYFRRPVEVDARDFERVAAGLLREGRLDREHVSAALQTMLTRGEQRLRERVAHAVVRSGTAEITEDYDIVGRGRYLLALHRAPANAEPVPVQVTASDDLGDLLRIAAGQALQEGAFLDIFDIGDLGDERDDQYAHVPVRFEGRWTPAPGRSGEVPAPEELRARIRARMRISVSARVRELMREARMKELAPEDASEDELRALADASIDRDFSSHDALLDDFAKGEPARYVAKYSAWPMWVCYAALGGTPPLVESAARHQGRLYRLHDLSAPAGEDAVTLEMTITRARDAAGIERVAIAAVKPAPMLAPTLDEGAGATHAAA